MQSVLCMYLNTRFMTDSNPTISATCGETVPPFCAELRKYGSVETLDLLASQCLPAPDNGPPPHYRQFSMRYSAHPDPVQKIVRPVPSWIAMIVSSWSH